MSVVMGVLAAALLVAGGAAVILWRHILDWSLDHLLPWIEANVPWLAGPTREALIQVDRAVGRIRLAWQQLRGHLLRSTAEFLRQSNLLWIVRITSWLVPATERTSATPSAVKHVTEREVDWQYLPEEVRAEWMRRGQSTVTLDITRIRDQELALEHG